MDSFPSLTSSRSSGAGHDSSLYIDGDNDPEPADEDDRQRFHCCVHGGLLREPFQTKCGHRVCRGCLGVLLEGVESRPCPVAEEDCLPVTRQNVSPDMSCVREMRKMMVYCVNKASGCQLTCKYQDLKNHVLECEYAVVTCPHASRGCQDKVLRKDLEGHVQSCVWRPTNCPLCRAEVSYCHMQYHDKEECEEKVTGCPYSCGNTTLRRKEVQGHRNACPVRLVSCKFEPMGCTFVNKKELVDQHIKDAINYHLELASSRLQEISQKRTDSEHEYQELSSRYTELEHSVQSVRTQEQAAIRQVEQQGRDFRLKMVDLIERVIMLERKLEGQMASGRQVQQLEHTLSDISRRLSQVEERQQRGDGGRDGGGQGVAGRYGSVSNMAEVVSTQLTDHDRQLSMHDVRMAEMDLRFQLLETASYDGTLVWKIRDYARRKRDAVSGRTLSLYSQPFYTSRFGYKMCARVYLNGDGMGKKTHMSIFFVVMRGEYDALLTWPFNLKVSLTLMDQSPRRRHLTDQFVPDPTSSSFQRPTGEMNVASGCPLFVSQSLVENPENGYVMDDTIFIRISVGQSAST